MWRRPRRRGACSRSRSRTALWFFSRWTHRRFGGMHGVPNLVRYAAGQRAGVFAAWIDHDFVAAAHDMAAVLIAWLPLTNLPAAVLEGLQILGQVGTAVDDGIDPIAEAGLRRAVDRRVVRRARVVDVARTVD